MTLAPQNTLIFDWNSTLLDDAQALCDAFNILFAQCGREPIDLQTYQDRYDMPIERFYGNHGFAAHEIPSLLPKFAEVFHSNYEPLAKSLPLRDGAHDVLSYAKDSGAHTIILSNHLRPPILEHLARFSIADYFSEVIAYPSRAEQFRKESKGQKLLRYLGENWLDPACSVIVGDSPEETVIAREQGIVSVAITGGCVSEARLRAAQPDYLIHSLTELKPILAERWGG
ncbi:MAG: HAD family hydrolase [Bdellovibrionales bacterium]